VKKINSAILILILLLLGTGVARAQSPDAVRSYVDRYRDIAIEEMTKTGIPASITLAQGIHESGCGLSVLAVNSNNHFGIKCHDGWAGDTYRHDDDQPQECFRVYNTPEESFRDHSDFLKNRPRYGNLFKLDPADYRGWARGLKAAGYATNPHYPDIIIKLVDDYRLNQYDQSGSTAHQAETPIKVTPKEHEKKISQAATQVKTPREKAAPTAQAPPIQLEEYKVNGVKAVKNNPLIKLTDIAAQYHLSMSTLLERNDLSTTDKAISDAFIFIEPKHSDCEYHQYEVSQGETMRDVAQKFGVTLEALYKRNGIYRSCEPLEGEVIVLRGKRDFPLRYRSAQKQASPSPLPVRSTSDAESITPESNTHIVSDKETLYSISRRYNIGLDTLIRINDLKDESIHPGQTLVVETAE
jgi:LysM repeat protein